METAPAGDDTRLQRAKDRSSAARRSEVAGETTDAVHKSGAVPRGRTGKLRHYPVASRIVDSILEYETSGLPVHLVILEVGVDGCSHGWMECPGTETLEYLEA